MEKNKQIEEYIQSHPHQFKDEIDKWLFREFGLLGGACSAQLSMQYSTAREVAEKAFEYSYLKAEKDMELTWEGLKLLQDISHEVFAEVANGSVDYYQIYPTQQSFLEEVLKRFKERKDGGKG